MTVCEETRVKSRERHDVVTGSREWAPNIVKVVVVVGKER